jgi:kynurenine formamidase
MTSRFSLMFALLVMASGLVGCVHNPTTTAQEGRSIDDVDVSLAVLRDFVSDGPRYENGIRTSEPAVRPVMNDIAKPLNIIVVANADAVRRGLESAGVDANVTNPPGISREAGREVLAVNRVEYTGIDAVATLTLSNWGGFAQYEYRLKLSHDGWQILDRAMVGIGCS